MRKLLYTLFIILLPSCDAMLPHTVTSDGKEIVGEVGSIYWEMAAPQRDITAYYSSKSVIDLCLMWEDLEDDDSYRNYQGIIKKRKNNIGESLHSRGYDYMYCDNPAKRKEKELKRELEREKYKRRKAEEEARRERMKSDY